MHLQMDLGRMSALTLAMEQDPSTTHHLQLTQVRPGCNVSERRGFVIRYAPEVALLPAATLAQAEAAGLAACPAASAAARRCAAMRASSCWISRSDLPAGGPSGVRLAHGAGGAARCGVSCALHEARWSRHCPSSDVAEDMDEAFTA